jgi:hypothetical protein
MYPDLEYIRRFVPIREVALQLGLRVAGGMVHCWRPDNHQHGDRTPSVGLQERRNFAKCFVCDERALSPIDLVMSSLGLDLRAAVKWITARYDVPAASRGKHIQHQERWPERFRVGAGTFPFDTLIRSGIWASLTPSQRSILPVLKTFARNDNSDNTVTISYRGLMRYAGIGSHSTVATALKRFQALHILQVQRGTGSDGLRACNAYRLTFDDPAFLGLANAAFSKQGEAIRLERELRAEARRQRRKADPFTSNFSVQWLERCSN